MYFRLYKRFVLHHGESDRTRQFDGTKLNLSLFILWNFFKRDGMLKAILATMVTTSYLNSFN